VWAQYIIVYLPETHFFIAVFAGSRKIHLELILAQQAEPETARSKAEPGNELFYLAVSKILQY